MTPGQGPPWADPEWRGWHGGRRWRGGRGPGGGAGFIGCFFLFLILVVGLVSALATWIAAAVLGILAPSAAPSAVTAVAVVIVVVLAVLLATRVFGRAVGPLTEIADATERLADGEPSVRVAPRGPGPVRRLAGSFNTMAERLDRTRDDRRSMLADVTHELRTPLTVVQGGLEAMVDGVHPMDEDHIAPLLAETAVMTRLLDDLRTLSLADAGALTLHREPADVAALAREVVAANASLAAAKRVTLEAIGDRPPGDRRRPGADPRGDREPRLERVAPHAVGGRVEVEVRGDDDAAIVTVRDTGEGIPSAELPRVFDRYQRRSDTGGTGLGLAIVRDLVAAHGGNVTAQSEGMPGRGSTFRVSIPRRD